MTRFIFVTGGVCSSLGKGITAASIGCLLKSRGLRIAVQKLDPYLNVDPGTMSPYQHGEVFVTGDGAETDLDLGHYERFTSVDTMRFNSVSSGQVYQSVINSERKGEYLGNTVQIIPHVTDRIKECIFKPGLNSHADIVITEIGGTVGDIESLPFLEAIRQIRHDSKPERVLYIHVTLLPHLHSAEELKSKPTQHSVKELRSLGIQPDMLVCRCESGMPESIRNKLSMICDVRADSVYEAPDVSSIYELPLLLEEQRLPDRVLQHLEIKTKPPDLGDWRQLVERIKTRKERKVVIALVGKYVELKDAYISVREALSHSAALHNLELDLKCITGDNDDMALEESDGIIVPGGFGERGTERKIKAIRFARENNVPFLGICLGMQLSVIEFARNVAGIAGANSTEFDEHAADPIISLMSEQKNITELGASMRLGLYPCSTLEGSTLRQVYGSETISERHRHRYEFNNRYREMLEEKGLVFSGTSPDKTLIEAVEIGNHPFFVAVQYHPEFLSRPLKPHPLFSAFIESAAAEHIKKK